MTKVEKKDGKLLLENIFVRHERIEALSKEFYDKKIPIKDVSLASKKYKIEEQDVIINVFKLASFNPFSSSGEKSTGFIRAFECMADMIDNRFFQKNSISYLMYILQGDEKDWLNSAVEVMSAHSPRSVVKLLLAQPHAKPGFSALLANEYFSAKKHIIEKSSPEVKQRTVCAAKESGKLAAIHKLTEWNESLEEMKKGKNKRQALSIEMGI